MSGRLSVFIWSAVVSIAFVIEVVKYIDHEPIGVFELLCAFMIGVDVVTGAWTDWREKEEQG